MKKVVDALRAAWHAEPTVILGVVATCIALIVGDVTWADVIPLLASGATRSQVSPVKGKRRK